MLSAQRKQLSFKVIYSINKYNYESINSKMGASHPRRRCRRRIPLVFDAQTLRTFALVMVGGDEPDMGCRTGIGFIVRTFISYRYGICVSDVFRQTFTKK